MLQHSEVGTAIYNKFFNRSLTIFVLFEKQKKEIQQYEVTKIKILITNPIVNVSFGGINDRSCSVIHDKFFKSN